MWTCVWKTSTPTAMACMDMDMDMDMAHLTLAGRTDTRRKIRMSNKMAKTLACIVMLGMLSLAGRFGASAQQPADTTSAYPGPIAPPLKIGSGDLITVTIFDS